MPVYTEERTLEEIVRRVCAINIPKELILVDDGSKDRSREILTRLHEENRRAGDALNEIKIFFQPQNEGKGSALKTALDHVTGDVVMIQDADLEYDPKDYPSLLQPIQEGVADVVYGTRLAGGRRAPRAFLLALHGQPYVDLAFQYAHQFKSLRHGSRLQSLSRRRIEGYQSR